MVRFLAFAVALVMAALLGVSGGMAQSKMDQPKDQKTDMKMDKKSSDMAQKIEGKIKTVSMNGAMVTLEDGTKLTIPKSVMVPKGQLKPGAMISAEYQDKAGKKVATSVEIKG